MNLKSKIVNKVSDVMSYPARRNAQKTQIKADADVRDIKLTREAGNNTEPIPNDYRSDLFRARANVAVLRSKQYEALQKLKSTKK